MNKRKPNEQGVRVVSTEQSSRTAQQSSEHSMRVSVNGKLNKTHKAEQDETKR